MSSGRSQGQSGAFGHAEPDASLPPPPPYVPVDRNNSSANQAQAQALASQQASQQRYAPPPGPPPGAGRPFVASPRASMNEGRSSQPTNPFADPSQGGHINPQLQNAYPPMQHSNAGPLNVAQASYGMPSGPASAGFGSPSFSSGPGSGGPPRRQGSVADHARKMSSDMAAGAQSTSQSSGTVRRASAVREDPLLLLKDFDTIFIVDDSASMCVNEMPDGSMGKSRWEEARDAVAGVVELAAKYDRDGVDVYFLNNERSIENCTDPREVLQVFDSIEPDGVTPTGMRLEILLLSYLDQIENHKDQAARGQITGPEPKKRNYIVITDGAATDDPESVIVATARRLDARNFPLSQIGIQFIQVGDDADATEALQDLDDALSKEHGIRDMVDTLTYSSMVVNADLIVKALLGGINRRLDRKKDQGRA